MPDFPFSTSFWFDPDIEMSPPLQGAREVDVAVVGGGFAGLSAARHLTLRVPGLGVALVEARHVSFGASGRSAGWVMSLPPLYWLLQDLEDRRRLDDVSFTARLARESNVEVARLVEREAIDCDWKPSRHLLVARNALEVATLRWLSPRFEAIGVPCERYDGERGGSSWGTRRRLPQPMRSRPSSPVHVAGRGDSSIVKNRRAGAAVAPASDPASRRFAGGRR